MFDLMMLMVRVAEVVSITSGCAKVLILTCPAVLAVKGRLSLSKISSVCLCLLGEAWQLSSSSLCCISRYWGTDNRRSPPSTENRSLGPVTPNSPVPPLLSQRTYEMLTDEPLNISTLLFSFSSLTDSPDL